MINKHRISLKEKIYYIRKELVFSIYDEFNITRVVRKYSDDLDISQLRFRVDEFNVITDVKFNSIHQSTISRDYELAR